MQLKSKAQEKTFLKLMIVETDMKNAQYHTILKMKKREFQKEFLFVKFKIKEIDLIIRQLIVLCARKKENAMNSIGQFKIQLSLYKITIKLIWKKKDQSIQLKIQRWQMIWETEIKKKLSIVFSWKMKRDQDLQSNCLNKKWLINN